MKSHKTHVHGAELCRGVPEKPYNWQAVMYWVAAGLFVLAIGNLGFAGEFMVSGLLVAGAAISALIAETNF